MSAFLTLEPPDEEVNQQHEVTARHRDRRERFVCVECGGKSGFFDCPDCFGTGTVE